MKITRRKRITIREREIVVSGNAASEIDGHFCPFCNAPIQPRELPVKKLEGGGQHLAAGEKQRSEP